MNVTYEALTQKYVICDDIQIDSEGDSSTIDLISSATSFLLSVMCCVMCFEL
jgi:hypothetical protein